MMENLSDVQQYDTELNMYILPNPLDDKDDPLKYSLNLDNIYKVGYFNY